MWNLTGKSGHNNNSNRQQEQQVATMERRDQHCRSDSTVHEALCSSSDCECTSVQLLCRVMRWLKVGWQTMRRWGVPVLGGSNEPKSARWERLD